MIFKVIVIVTLTMLLQVTSVLADNHIDNNAESNTQLTLGVGLAVTKINDYIGADESQLYTLPVPYIYYQSDKVTIDRNAFEGSIFTRNRWYLALDAAGSIPVDSEKNEARKGMADLDWVGELGPSVEYYLLGNHRSINNAYIDFSIRKAVATDFSRLTDAGWTSQLSLKKNHQLPSLFLSGKTKINAAITALAYSDKYSQYFYSVSKDEVTSTRQFYNAKGGYAGLRLSLGATWRKDNIWVGIYTRYTHLDNTAYENSPLVKSKNDLLAGIVVSYIFIDN